jgi:hypothetical protein
VAPNIVDQQEVKAGLKLRLASAFLPNHSFRKLYGGLIADLMLSSRSGDPHADMLDKLLGTRGRAYGIGSLLWRRWPRHQAAAFDSIAAVSNASWLK